MCGVQLRFGAQRACGSRPSTRLDALSRGAPLDRIRRYRAHSLDTYSRSRAGLQPLGNGAQSIESHGKAR